MIACLIKMAICSGVFLLAYFLLLQKEKMYRFNRIYLLVAILLSLPIPFINIEWIKDSVTAPQPLYMVVDSGEKINSILNNQVEQMPVHNWTIDPFLALYILITIFFLARFAFNLLLLIKKIRNCQRVPYQKANLVLNNSNHLPYSFLSYIFLSKQAFENGEVEEEILHHELAHVQQKHSWDILFVELVLCFVWFNPFFYAYKKTIQLNHEFLADAEVITRFGDARYYQNILLNKSSTAYTFSFSSPFNYQITKKRLIMMTKTTSPGKILLKKVGALCLSAVAIVFFSAKPITQNLQDTFLRQQTGNMRTDTAKPRFALKPSLSIGYTKEGASAELLREYANLEDKYRLGDTINWKKLKLITKEDRVKMETIFKQMSLQQQDMQELVFFKVGHLPKIVPSKGQLNDFKNAAVYGIWIDGKKVSNGALEHYQNTDFSQVYISRLTGAAKKGKSYAYQVDFMTSEYYRQYVQKTLAEGQTVLMMVNSKSESSKNE